MRFAGVSPSARKNLFPFYVPPAHEKSGWPAGYRSANLIRDSEALEERVNLFHLCVNSSRSGLLVNGNGKGSVFAFVATIRSPAWRSRDCPVSLSRRALTYAPRARPAATMERSDARASGSDGSGGLADRRGKPWWPRPTRTVTTGT